MEEHFPTFSAFTTKCREIINSFPAFAVFVVVSIALVAAWILSGGNWETRFVNYRLSTPTQPSDVVTNSSENIPQMQEMHISTSDYGAWHSITQENPLFSKVMGEGVQPTEAYAVRDITSGIYAGNLLAIVFTRYHRGPDEYIPNIDTGTPSAFYIADRNGNPLALVGDDSQVDYGMGSKTSFPETSYITFAFPDWRPQHYVPISDLPSELKFIADVANSEPKADSTMYIDDAKSTTADPTMYDPTMYIDDAILHVLGRNTNVLQVQASIYGMPVVKVPLNSNVPIVDEYMYFVTLPFGGSMRLSLKPNFLSDDGVNLQLSWNNGNKVESYNWGDYAYGFYDCFEGITPSQLRANMVRTGSTASGGPLYELPPAPYTKVYKCLYEKTKQYDYDSMAEQSTSHYPQTYSDFTTSHPIFFWQHPYGALMSFIRSDIQPPAEKAKPVIYLYPKKTERVSVHVDPIGGFTKTDPAYGIGWNVVATPEGKLTNRADDKTYPYLFWEGGKEGIVVTPKEGFVVARQGVAPLLEKTLSAMGLNDTERSDFIEFWAPRLTKAPYYFITFISRSEIDRVAPLSVSPAPDTVIRVLMDYKPLAAPIVVDPLPIIPTVREGFTVVEWGGIIRD